MKETRLYHHLKLNAVFNLLHPHFYLSTIHVYTPIKRPFHATQKRHIPPLSSLITSHSPTMPMPQNLPPPMHTQTPLPHNLTLNTCSPRRNILKHHSTKVAKTELSRAITDQHTIGTARGRVGRGGSDDLVVLAGCAWGDGLPD
jgi:hypothetical protein